MRSIDMREYHQSVAFCMHPDWGSDPQSFGGMTLQPTESPCEVPEINALKVYLVFD